MTNTLQTFLRGLIDYAGVFPPARLPLEQALARYELHVDSSEAFMLGRFLVPAYDIVELADMRAERSVDALAVSVITRSADTVAALTGTLEEDLRQVYLAEERSGGAVRCEALEIKLPEEAAEVGALAPVFETVASSLRSVEAFFEVPLVGGGLPAAYRVIEQVAAQQTLRSAGVKLRCGGLSPEAFPSAAEVAHVIAAACESGVPFKATAGLHHPIRHHNPNIPTWEHGFLNVFGAAALAHTLRLAPAQIEAVVRETRLDRFTATNERFGWADLTISTDQLAEARRFATSYGSCSFDEPIADLRAAGWLQVQAA